MNSVTFANYNYSPEDLHFALRWTNVELEDLCGEIIPSNGNRYKGLLEIIQQNGLTFLVHEMRSTDLLKNLVAQSGERVCYFTIERRLNPFPPPSLYSPTPLDSKIYRFTTGFNKEKQNYKYELDENLKIVKYKGEIPEQFDNNLKILFEMQKQLWDLNPFGFIPEERELITSVLIGDVSEERLALLFDKR